MKLEDIPEKDLRKYEKSRCIGFRSSWESVCGRVRWFKWEKGECSVLSNMYPCRIEYEGIVFSSVEQMFHYYVYSNLPEAQDLIMKANDGKEVKKVSKQYKEDDTPLKDKFRLLQICLEHKYRSCPEFRKRLKETQDLPIVEVTTWWDVVYGTVDGENLKNGHFNGEFVGDCFLGMNATGRCIMQVRENHKNDVQNENEHDKI